MLHAEGPDIMSGINLVYQCLHHFGALLRSDPQAWYPRGLNSWLFL